jgi:hypothetical protein
MAQGLQSYLVSGNKSLGSDGRRKNVQGVLPTSTNPSIFVKPPQAASICILVYPSQCKKKYSPINYNQDTETTSNNLFNTNIAVAVHLFSLNFSKVGAKLPSRPSLNFCQFPTLGLSLSQNFPTQPILLHPWPSAQSSIPP